MSSLVFHDTVTLFLRTSVADVYEKRVVSRVKTVVTHGDQNGKTKATVFIPLWGRRSLRYCPDAWDGRGDRFTVRPSDVLVCRRETSGSCPNDALTVRSVICRQSGSRRLWHLEIHADNENENTHYEEVFPYEGTTT